MSKYDEQLVRELRSRADDISGHPISLDDVKASATAMRWRRRAATGVALAALVGAVPAGVALVDSNNGQPGITSPSPTLGTSSPPTTTPTTAPANVHKVVLTADTENHGGEPQIITSFNGDIVDIHGSATHIGATWAYVVRNGETPDAAWLGLEAGPDGNWLLRSASQDGKTLSAGIPVYPRLAVTPSDSEGGGSQVAFYTTDDDTLHLISPTGNDLDSWQFAAKTEVSPIGILDDGVVFNVGGNEPAVMIAHPGGDTQPILGLISAGGVYAPDNLVSGMTQASDFGSCSTVMNASTSQKLWETCDYSLGAFSPDGRYVIGHPAYRDGIGDASVAVLDAQTGDPLVEYDARTKQGSFINGNTVWDADGTLLTMLYDDGWALMRLTTDGVFSSVSTGRIAGAPEDVPLFFSARP